MPPTEFVRTLKARRAEWEALLARVGEARMTEPGPAGEWSLKDVIAHITWGEREMVGVLIARALVGSPLWDVPQLERNTAVYEQNRHRPLDEVLAEAWRTHRELLQALEPFSDEELNDATRFANWPPAWIPDWPPARLIAGNTYGHYAEHIPSIRAWLESKTDA